LEPSRFETPVIIKKMIDAFLARSELIRRLDSDMISGSSLVCSLIVYLLISRRMLIGSLFALLFVLFLDALDGAVARARADDLSIKNWIVDVSADRISEALISIALSRFYIFLAIFNTGLTMYSCKFKRHLIIPLRHFLFFILLFRFIIKSQFIFSILDGMLFDW
jgi:phosphatidylglycerophosphate synthase